MAGKNIFKGLLNPSYKPPRNAFDLSQRHIFSLKAGALTPICAIDYVPNDYFEINMADLIRTMPLNTAAFLRAKVHFDWYAVPYRQLFKRFNQFAVTRRDLQSANEISQSINYQPNVSLGALQLYGVNQMPVKGITNQTDSIRLLDNLGYGDFSKVYSAGGTNPWNNLTVSPFRLAAYQKIYHDYYRNPWRDVPLDDEVCTWNFDELPCTNPSTALLDNYNYQFGADMLWGYPANYNASRINELCRLRYRGWKKDIFMGSLPDSQFGVVSSVPVDIVGSLSGISGNDLNRWSAVSGSSLPSSSNVSTHSSYKSLAAGSDSPLKHDHLVTVNNQAGLLSGGFDILQLRYYTALQKWKESVMRAGYRTKNQFEAQFGSYDEHDKYDMCIHVGSTMTQIGIDEVISTSTNTYNSSQQSGNGALGEIAGKGIGVGNHPTFKFSAGGTYGVLMCIVSVIPESEYDSNMIEKNVRRFEFDDYFSPMFDNLGLDSITTIDLAADFSNYSSAINSVIGYAPRNWEYKCAVDKVHGSFKHGGQFNAWVTPRFDLENLATAGLILKEQYYINPCILDSVFAAQIEGRDPSDNNGWTYETDQFIVNCNFIINAVRGMSVLGLPQW